MTKYLGWTELNGTEVAGDHFVNKDGHLSEITWVSRGSWTYRIIRRNVGNPSTSKVSTRVCKLGSCEFKAEDNVRLATALSKLR